MLCMCINQKCHLNFNSTITNSDNHSYLNQLCENHPRFLNISSIRKNKPRRLQNPQEMVQAKLNLAKINPLKII